MTTLQPAGCSIQSIATGLLLQAMRATKAYDRVAIAGLPSHTIHVSDREAIIAVATATDPAHNPHLEAIAARHRADVVLLHVDADDAGPAPIRADCALGSLPFNIWSGCGLTLYRWSHETWLVPEHLGMSVSIGIDGLNLEMIPPYATMSQRRAGVIKARRDVTRLLHRMETR